MKAQKLVKMANEIAAFFSGEATSRDACLESVAAHLKRFWDPRMRRELLAWIDEHGGEGLGEVALAAIRAHRDRIQPPERQAVPAVVPAAPPR